MTPATFDSHISRQWSSSASPIGSSPSAPPALWTITSTSETSAASASTEAGSATSSRSARPPTSSASASSRSSRRAAEIVSRPAAARARTVASPIPLEAPVTRAMRRSSFTRSRLLNAHVLHIHRLPGARAGSGKQQGMEGLEKSVEATREASFLLARAGEARSCADRAPAAARILPDDLTALGVLAAIAIASPTSSPTTAAAWLWVASGCSSCTGSATRSTARSRACAESSARATATTSTTWWTRSRPPRSGSASGSRRSCCSRSGR